MEYGDWIKEFKCKKCGKQLDDPDERFHEHCTACWDILQDWQQENETSLEHDIICPYCGEKQDDYGRYSDNGDEYTEIECQCCGSKFDLRVDTVYSTWRSLCEMPEGWTAEGEEDE